MQCPASVSNLYPSLQIGETGGFVGDKHIIEPGSYAVPDGQDAISSSGLGGTFAPPFMGIRFPLASVVTVVSNPS